MQPGTILIGLGLVLLILLDTYDPRFIVGLKPTLAKTLRAKTLQPKTLQAKPLRASTTLGRIAHDVPANPKPARPRPRPTLSVEAVPYADLIQEMDEFCLWLEQRRSQPVGS